MRKNAGFISLARESFLFFFCAIGYSEPCDLRSTQPLKMSTRDFSWGKGGRCVWLTTYYPYSAEKFRKSRVLTYPEPLGPPRPVARDLYLLPPTEPCALRSTQPLKVNTRDFSWGKGGRCVWLTTYYPCSAETSRNPGP